MYRKKNKETKSILFYAEPMLKNYKTVFLIIIKKIIMLRRCIANKYETFLRKVQSRAKVKAFSTSL